MQAQVVLDAKSLPTRTRRHPRAGGSIKPPQPPYSRLLPRIRPPAAIPAIPGRPAPPSPSSPAALPAPRPGRRIDAGPRTTPAPVASSSAHSRRHPCRAPPASHAGPTPTFSSLSGRPPRRPPQAPLPAPRASPRGPEAAAPPRASPRRYVQAFLQAHNNHSSYYNNVGANYNNNSL